jgi:hypothetical protein
MELSLSSLTFGCEFEVIVPSTFTRASAAAELARRIGKPVDGGFGSTGRNWKIVNDGSVHGSGGQGLEFVSPYLPPLQGQAGLDEVALVANSLRDMGCIVNTSCGFHVHVGARGMGLVAFKNLVKLYARYEETLDGLMPQSRRGNRADYCKSIARVNFSKVDRAGTVTQLAQEIYRSSGAHAPRYHKLNLEAYAKHQTVEFRQHSGTVDATKAVNWIVVCLKLVAAAKAGKSGGEGVRIAQDFSALPVKTRASLEMMSRPEGATRKEICEAFGLEKISPSHHAKISGYAHRKVGSRYFLVTENANGSTTSTPITLEGLADLIGADADLSAYLQTRFATLRAAVAR